jgi:Histidine kinase-, DNA gyrase B-, and HSP90-like ATPase
MSKGRKVADSQGSLFEDDFLLRTLGDHVRIPDVALGELVANAWDAGAQRVDIRIPEESGDSLRVADNGTGFTKDQFFERWMKLAYNRQKHQGPYADFPPGHQGKKRRAYGRNGQGRHGLLCFGDSYEVETTRNGELHRFRVRASSGEEAIHGDLIETRKASGHGTQLIVQVTRRLPDPDRIRDVLASRFLYDPTFSIVVNGKSLALDNLQGLTEKRIVEVHDPESDRKVKLFIFAVEGDAGRNKHQSGVAFWVGSRLVGDPGWIVGGVPVLDGRTRLGRRLTFIVRSDDFPFEDVEHDWTRFKPTALVKRMMHSVVEAVQDVLNTVMTAHVQDTAEEALTGVRSQLDDLAPGERLEVAEAVESVAAHHPLLAPSSIAAVMSGVIAVKRKSSPQALIERIMQLPEEDQAGLQRILDEWTVRDALTVLDEIGRRIKVVEVLQKLVDDPSIDEVHVIHPLVTKARWLFGPEYESPLYASNVSLRNAVSRVFTERIRGDAFENPRKRIDLLFLPNSTLSVVATEDVDGTTQLATMRRVLLIELKKGGSKIGREEMMQTEGYVEDLLHCGLLDGPPFIQAFVVGRELNERTTAIKTMGVPEQARVQAVTFGQLIRTANARLFRVRETVQERYSGSGQDLLDRIMAQPHQMDLLGVLKKGSQP